MAWNILLSLIPQYLVPYVQKLLAKEKTRTSAWLTMAEVHCHEFWAFHIYKEIKKCSPREIRFAYGCRWEESLEKMELNHKMPGRLIIDGHYSYFVRNDLAIQSRSFYYDRALISVLIDDKNIYNDIQGTNYNQFVFYLGGYFILNHREFFEKIFTEYEWSRIGIPTKDLKNKCYDNGILNIKKYDKEIANYKETIEYKLISNPKSNLFKDILIYDEIKNVDKIQPNRILNIPNTFTEYYKEDKLLQLMEYEKQKMNEYL